MDRRVVGLAGLLLLSGGRVGSAQSVPRKDPSAQPSVSLSSLPSIGDTINNTTLGALPPAYAAMPTTPVGNGPPSAIPRSPGLTSPISLTPIEPIHQTINRGIGTGRLASIFRNPGARPAAPANVTPAARPTAPASFNRQAAPPTMPPPPTDEPASPLPAGRPAPYAGQAPEWPRAQAQPPSMPDANAGAGRPAPLADAQPRFPRPQAAVTRDPNPRPRAEPANPPAFQPAEVLAPAAAPIPVDTVPPIPPVEVPPTSPVELPPAPVLEPLPAPTGVTDSPAPALEAVPTPPVVTALPEVSSSPPPEGSDPLKGIEPIVPVSAPPPEAPAAPLMPPSVEQPKAAPSLPDPEVRRTSQDTVQDPTALQMKGPRAKSLPYATLRAAAVGDQIITINELEAEVKEQMRDFTGGQQGQISDAELWQVKNQVAAMALNRLIDQSLILQQAKHKMEKNEKGRQQFNEMIDKLWKTDEIPPLLRKYGCTNIYELKAKLALEGKSLESMKEVFRKKTISHEFLRAEIHNKLTCDLAEQRAYYNEHLNDFEQPARMTWREIEISFAKHPNRAAARQKADNILARLLRDEDFGAVAKVTSDGPTASKGGVYVDMQPGSYGIPVVNDELNRIPVGQVSSILEAPGAFHIIRVDSRREKGPLRFDEVQDKIRDKVFVQNFQIAVDAYLTKLRSKTLIRTMFDKTESDPTIARRTDPAVQRTSATNR